jgi:CRISPR system Cascade subunit CasC
LNTRFGLSKPTLKRKGNSMTRFVQIHSLASYPAALLNRDDAGLAKRMPYGGASRIRISSQCLKRHWRLVEDEWSLKKIGAPMGIRSREIVEREIKPKLKASEPVVDAVCAALVRHLYGKNSASIKDRQALLLGGPEIEYLTRMAQEAAAEATDARTAEAAIDARFGKGDGRRNLATMKEVAGDLAAGLEAALFGRMVTSDPEANTNAAIHVAHSFTVHKEESESDYFTVVDDLRVRDEEAGSAGIFDTELTSGLFYGYVVVDVSLLVKNLSGDSELAAKVIERLIHLVATVSPGAKRGSTAPYAYADLIFIETGRRQPRSLAGAFRRPIALNKDGSDLRAEAISALQEALTGFDSAYGSEGQRSHLATIREPVAGMGEKRPLDDLAAWAASAVRAVA